MKRCAKCKKEFPETIEYFYFRKDSNKFGYFCKECEKEYSRQYTINNRKNISERRKEYIIKNKEKIRESQKRYRKNNKEKIKKAKREYYLNNKVKMRESYLKNKDRILKWQRKYFKERRKTDSAFRLRANMGKGISKSLRYNKNGHHWEDLVNYTQEDLRNHLERQFEDNMSWENYGEWQVDHIIPVSLFNITSTRCKGFKKCWCLENLQPMWAKDNLKKGNRLFV